MARIRAVLRRTQEEKEGRVPEIIRVGDVELDPATRTVRQKGKPVELTSVEFNLLQVLLREAGRVVTREFLVDAVLSRKFSPFDRSIDMHVSKVRKKLGDSDGDADYIKTVRGVGYIFTHAREKAKSGAKSEACFSRFFSPTGWHSRCLWCWRFWSRSPSGRRGRMPPLRLCRPSSSKTQYKPTNMAAPKERAILFAVCAKPSTLGP